MVYLLLLMCIAAIFAAEDAGVAISVKESKFVPIETPTKLFHSSSEKIRVRNGILQLRRLEEVEVEMHQGKGDDEEDPKAIRTATGGIVYTILMLLTAVAFVGNGAFLIYVFWMSK